MKQKIYQQVLFTFLVITLLALTANPVWAQGATTGDTVSFSMLAQTDLALRGPLDIQSFSFNLPADWELLEGSLLHLNYNAVFTTSASADSNAVPAAGYIEVSLNNKLIGTIVINTVGENSIDLPIPANFWVATDPTQARQTSHSLQFYLKTAGECRATNNTTNANSINGLSVIIRSTSYLLLPHRNASVSTDLRNLPYPIYQDSFIPDKATLVMPDSPTAAELQAVMTTSAAFGRLTKGKLALDFSTASKIDPARFADTNMIFVGKPSAFPVLAQAKWPAQVSGQGFANAQIGADDGVLQSTTSPANPAIIWLLVSGQSDAGVIKAAQSLGSGQVRTTDISSLSLVTSTQSLPVSNSNIADHTFNDFGYTNVTRWGPGVRYIVYNFQVPAGVVVSPGAYLDLVFSHTSLFDFEQSGLSIVLNNDYIGGFRFSDRTTQVTSWRLNLPSSSFVPGDNSLTIEANLEPTTHCVDNQELWFSTRSESVLHMPLEAAPLEPVSTYLSDYPAPFVPSFDTIAFVLPKSDQLSWTYASKLAYDLGQKTGGAIINPLVVFADAVPDNVKKERNLLLVGRPSQLPIMQELSSSMPAPFKVGSDIADEPPAGFTFRVSNNKSVGYLQVFPAPWNSQRSIMTVSGNNAEGLLWSINALIIPAQRDLLSGNLAVLYDNQIIATKVGVAPVMVAVSPTPQPLVDTQTQQVQGQNNLKVDPLMLGTIAVVILVVLGVLVWWVGGRSKKQ